MQNTQDYTCFSNHLAANEHIVWQGRPEKGNYITPVEIIQIPFGLPFLGFSLFWEFNALRTNIPFMILWGLPFVAFGAYLSFGRFLHAAYMRDKAFYVVTNQKLIIKNGSRITTYTENNLPPMTLYMHKNGNGTIYFTEVYYRRGRRRHSGFALENIQNPVQAQNAIDLMK